MYCAEVKTDREFFTHCEHTPTSYCNEVGFLGPSTVLVQMVHLDNADEAKLAETGTHVAHCPTSNSKITSRICPVPELLASNVNNGLSTDAVIHKAKSYDPTTFNVEQVLEMATINVAEALGLQDSIRSLEVGKKADFVAIGMRKVRLQSYSSAVSAVMYTATGRDVEIVIVDGKPVVKNGLLMTMNEEEV